MNISKHALPSLSLPLKKKKKKPWNRELVACPCWEENDVICSIWVESISQLWFECYKHERSLAMQYAMVIIELALFFVKFI